MKQKASQETIVAALNDYKGGMTYPKICEKHKVSYAAAQYWVQRAGVQRPKNSVDWNKVKELISH